MQNIDPLFIVEALVIIGFSFGLVIYWVRKGRLPPIVFIYSLAAYGLAILLKEVLQYLTYDSFLAAYGSDKAALGLYFGLQTVFFEVGLAYVFAVLATRAGKLRARDAVGYGLALAMWENGVLLGVFTLLSYVSIYVILSTGGSVASLLYSTLQSQSPSLFFAPAQALPLVFFGVMERVSSLLAHLAWGYLVVIAAVLKKRNYFLIALPMGMLDFFVPFDTYLTLAGFETLIFAVALSCALLAYWLGRRIGPQEQLPSYPTV